VPLDDHQKARRTPGFFLNKKKPGAFPALMSDVQPF
jgi:hypothetical protein